MIKEDVNDERYHNWYALAIKDHCIPPENVMTNLNHFYMIYLLYYKVRSVIALLCCVHIQLSHALLCDPSIPEQDHSATKNRRS